MLTFHTAEKDSAIYQQRLDEADHDCLYPAGSSGA